MLSRFERGRLPVAARLPALLWIVFFYSLNNLKMVDFRGFKHSDVPKEGRGSGNKHRGVQKSKRLGRAGRGPGEELTSIGESKKAKKNLSRFERGRLPVAARLPALLWIVFFYSLNIPKKADFRGFKHSDVLEGAREGVNKHRGVQKSKRNFLSRFERGRLPVAARLPALL
ncbi:hypothetical protein ACOMHN_002776 [Nucella lapillus]